MQGNNVDKLIESFVSSLKYEGKAQSTIIAYRKDLEQIAAAIECGFLEADKTVLQAAIANLQAEQKFTAKTISRKLNSLKTFYNYLLVQNLISANSAADLQHPKIFSPPPRYLQQVEIMALREATKDNLRLMTMVETLLQTGVRISELAALKLQNLVLDQKNPQLVVEAYSTIPTRTVPINDKLYTQLQTFLAGRKLDKDAPVFPTRDGKHIIIRNIRSAVDRAMQKAGIEDACVNDLRNTFIVAQMNAGLPLDYIAQVAGHRSRATTQKYIAVVKDGYKPSGKFELIEV